MRHYLFLVPAKVNAIGSFYCGINAEPRQKGKIATLACGYNGSIGALKAMGALRMGLAEHELKPIVDACQLMTTPPDWAAGLPLDADGYECDCYRKD